MTEVFNNSSLGEAEHLEFNGLRPGEADRLARLALECSKVAQAVGQLHRLGYPECDLIANRRNLATHLGDFHAALLSLIGAGDIDGGMVGRRAAWKLPELSPSLRELIAESLVTTADPAADA